LKPCPCIVQLLTEYTTQLLKHYKLTNASFGLFTQLSQHFTTATTKIWNDKKIANLTRMFMRC